MDYTRCHTARESALIQNQNEKIYRYCYFKLHNRELAEDITQETFLRYLEKIPVYLFRDGTEVSVYHRRTSLYRWISETGSSVAGRTCQEKCRRSFRADRRSPSLGDDRRSLKRGFSAHRSCAAKSPEGAYSWWAGTSAAALRQWDACFRDGRTFRYLPFCPAAKTPCSHRKTSKKAGITDMHTCRRL